MWMAEDLENFWKYIRERERIRLLRESGASYPWTTDPIFCTYKFTNVRRLHDRTTQKFLKMYRVNCDDHESVALYNCGIYRYHGTISFMERIGWRKQHDHDLLVKTAREMLEEGAQVYTGAYIITNGGRVGFKEEVVSSFLEGLAKASVDITARIEKENSWKSGYELMIHLPGFGGSGFMTKEVLQDYILWRQAAGRAPLKDEVSWTPVGPGARRGLNRLYGRPLRFQQKEFKFVEEIRGVWVYVDPWFRKEFSDSLTMHDVQFCVCEYDKYERVRLGEGRPRARYIPPAR